MISQDNRRQGPAFFEGEPEQNTLEFERTSRLRTGTNYDFPNLVNGVVTVNPSLTATLGPVSSPRNSVISTADVTFSQPINPSTLSSSAWALTRNGVPVSLTGSVTFSLVSGTTYRINGLGNLTKASGTYVLSLDLAKVKTLSGIPGSGSTLVPGSWIRRDRPPPSRP